MLVLLAGDNHVRKALLLPSDDAFKTGHKQSYKEANIRRGNKQLESAVFYPIVAQDRMERSYLIDFASKDILFQNQTEVVIDGVTYTLEEWWQFDRQVVDYDNEEYSPASKKLLLEIVGNEAPAFKDAFSSLFEYLKK